MKYVVKKGGMYINYISLFTSKPLRLRDTKLYITSIGREARQQPHIIYTEKEARVVLQLEKDAKLIPVIG